MVRPAKLSHKVYQEIAGLIDAGEFPEGLKLPTEIELSQQFGVSRSVIRRVMEQLRDNGRIETIRGSGSFVIKGRAGENVVQTPLGPIHDFQITGMSDVLKCHEARMLFEGEMAALAAQRWEPSDMEAMEAALAQIVKDGPHSLGTVEDDLDFHRAIMKASKNEFAVAIFEAIQPQILIGINLVRGLYNLLPNVAVEKGLKEHRHVLEAIRSRDPELAREAMRGHITFFEDDIRSKAKIGL
ncbi:FadR/GntR family transcriptional regulator [Polycladidibacter stylochi]|uniref:FadR/GntR family transcriptional regulator n=1 Tax=Polycladidibacter stylochi TaxID=1807766 RepID=UPI000836CE1E|nr:FadR/GntR family transcriptional regulator [Pseudovibrio stylochi]